jgi:hypothetical protein
VPKLYASAFKTENMHFEISFQLMGLVGKISSESVRLVEHAYINIFHWILCWVINLIFISFLCFMHNGRQQIRDGVPTKCWTSISTSGITLEPSAKQSSNFGNIAWLIVLHYASLKSLGFSCFTTLSTFFFPFFSLSLFLLWPLQLLLCYRAFNARNQCWLWMHHLSFLHL